MRREEGQRTVRRHPLDLERHAKNNDVIDQGEPEPIFSDHIEFTGTVGAFYRIWLLNMIMTIVSIGILYPWAHRNINTYLCHNTKLDGECFEYKYSPWRFFFHLISRIVWLLFISIIAYVYPAYAILFVLISLPNIINGMIRRHLHMRSYREVAFDYKGNYLETLIYVFLFPFMALLTSGLLLPFAMKKLNQYLIRHIQLKGHAFQTRVNYFHYSNITLIVVLFILTFLGLTMGMLVLVAIFESVLYIENTVDQFIYSIVVNLSFIIWFVSMVSALATMIYTKIRVEALNHSDIPNILSFEITTQPLSYAIFVAKKMPILILSLGLAYPWIKIRKLQRLASETRVTIYPQALNIFGVKKSKIRNKNFDV